MATSVNTV